ncbi:MAG: M15 family metallopeptidase [Chlamydiia bacterium]|nr:M15 family metallopeptidase [Chlamydiia bacterium]MCP5510222.1 M15 family metallopeptidase [Chlamydiales bacterium]
MLVLLDDERIELDLKYASTDNFTGRVHYPSAKCYLEEEVAQALLKVADRAECLDLRLKIWDGYRPLSVQWAFWEFMPDERFISHPAKGGKHPRGTAVDLTLIDRDGTELLMPTPFDDFTIKAYRSCQDVPEEARKNRQLLEDLMEGFIGLPNEWWHFDYHRWTAFEPKDLCFEEL